VKQSGYNKYMEISQGNSLCSYLKQTKMSFFFLLQNWRTWEQNRSYGGRWYQLGVGRRWGKGRVNIMQILCTHVYKWENDTCWNYSRNRGRGNEGEWWRVVNSTMIYCKNFCKYHKIPLLSMTIKIFKMST
jgi:hypothetical protein